MKKNYYELLGVSEDASMNDIKSSYRKLKKNYDSNKNHSKNAEKRQRQIEKAYRVLSKEESRKEYDLSLTETSVEKEEVVEPERKAKGEKKMSVSKNNNESNPAEKKNKVANTIIIILGVIALIGGLFLLSEVAAKSGKDTTPVKELTEITYTTFKEKVNGSEKTVVMVGRPDCSWCQKIKPILEKINGKYSLDIQYLNVNNFTQEEYQDYLTIDTQSASQGLGTPMTFIVSEGKIQARLDGYVEQDELETFLKDNGIIS